MPAQNSAGNAYVLGVGLTKFLKPRRTREYPELGYEAGVKAMIDAKITYDDVETGVACYCYGDTTVRKSILLLQLNLILINAERSTHILSVRHDIDPHL